MHTATDAYEVRYLSLFDSGRGYAFPCDAHGRVNLDELTDRARENYLYVRALVGRDYAAPALMHVRACIG